VSGANRHHQKPANHPGATLLVANYVFARIYPAGFRMQSWQRKTARESFMPVTIPNPVKATQDNWRFCSKCLSLFWNGATHNGHCPAGGAHKADSWNFYLLADPDNFIHQGNEPEGP
jgi:hypothetical protein